MRVKDSVKVNADYINAYLRRNNITAKEFSQKLLLCTAWWSQRRSSKNYYVPRITAMRMCDVFGFKWSDIVGENPPQEPEEPKEPIKESNEAKALKEFALILQNIDEKLKTIEQQLKGLEWLHK